MQLDEVELIAAILEDKDRVLGSIRGSPKKLVEATETTLAVMRSKERKVYEDSFEDFIIRAWPEVDPAELVLNWHHRVIADQLLGIMRMENKNLIVNIPPRTGKTTIANILFPAWVWAQPPEDWGPLCGPHVQFLCVSYGANLSEEIAVKMRRLVMGEWYQSLWGDRVKILPDQQARANFGNTAGGARISASIEGGILGKGGDIQIIDDPMTPAEANSPVERERVMRDIREGLRTRFNNPTTGARVLLMQRVHMDDPTNHALEHWTPNVHLMFPMRFESNFPCMYDLRAQLDDEQLARLGRRTAEGMLLWPQQWPEAEVSALEVELGTYGRACQLQQYPIPRGGGIIGPDDWKIWPEDEPHIEDLKDYGRGLVTLPLPEVSHVIGVLDTAQSEKDTADFNAFVLLGVWHRKRNAITYQRPIRMAQLMHMDDDFMDDDGEQARVIMMGAWRIRGKLNDHGRDRQGNPTGVIQRIMATVARYKNIDRIIIENQNRGIDVRNEIIRQFGEEAIPIQLFNPKKHGDKVARLNAVQPLFEQGLIYAPANVTVQYRDDGSTRVRVGEFDWVRQVCKEVSQVPMGKHDDYADCISMGLLTLRTEGFLALTNEFLAQQVRDRVWKGRKETVAEAYGV